MKFGKVRLTWPFSWIREEPAQAANDRAAIGILARSLVTAAEALEEAAEKIRNGQATPMMSQRAKRAATTARQTLEDLGITRRAPAAASTRAKP